MFSVLWRHPCHFLLCHTGFYPNISLTPRSLENTHPPTSEKVMAPHSSTLAWKIPWTEEPGRLQSMGSEESDTTERLHFHFSVSCIGEGNGSPLQCCLENPRDGGAWWAALYGIAQSQTRLKQLSSSSSSSSKTLMTFQIWNIGEGWREKKSNLDSWVDGSNNKSWWNRFCGKLSLINFGHSVY